MTYVLVCRGDAIGEMADDGKYLKSYDIDADDGVGAVEWGTLDEAKRFATLLAAVVTTRLQSTVHPTRLVDGKPNRPLTAWHWEVVKV